jgi:hypothetical protein
MENLIKEIMMLMNCTEEEAKTIFDTTFQVSNVARKAVINSIKNQYDIR